MIDERVNMTLVVILLEHGDVLWRAQHNHEISRSKKERKIAHQKKISDRRKEEQMKQVFVTDKFLVFADDCMHFLLSPSVLLSHMRGFLRL